MSFGFSIGGVFGTLFCESRFLDSGVLNTLGLCLHRSSFS